MVCSCLSPARVAACLIVLALARYAVAADRTSSAQQPISVDAASSEVDYKKNTAVFHDVVITQGDIRVEAKHAETEATGLHFDAGRFTFTGDVHMRVEQRGDLRSDQAVVDFRNNQIVKATITGKPAEFEQKRDNSDVTAHGHANEIVYDPNEGVVRLSQDAWLSNGGSEIRGPLLVYNIRKQSVQGASQPDGSERVRITIIPGQIPGQDERNKPK